MVLPSLFGCRGNMLLSLIGCHGDNPCENMTGSASRSCVGRLLYLRQILQEWRG
jgi:hypothetical protein